MTQPGAAAGGRSDRALRAGHRLGQAAPPGRAPAAADRHRADSGRLRGLSGTGGRGPDQPGDAGSPTRPGPRGAQADGGWQGRDVELRASPPLPQREPARGDLHPLFALCNWGLHCAHPRLRDPPPGGLEGGWGDRRQGGSAALPAEASSAGNRRWLPTPGAPQPAASSWSRHPVPSYAPIVGAAE
jgi:hypothetical protein